jgi:hypothetical protein
MTTALALGSSEVVVKRRDIAEVAAAANESPGTLQAMLEGVTSGAKNAAG